MIKNYFAQVTSNKKSLFIAVFMFILSATVLNVTIANETKTENETVAAASTDEVKSLAYYVANSKEALKKNRECFDKGLDMQNDLNCAYSRHALEISYVGGDKINPYKFKRD